MSAPQFSNVKKGLVSDEHRFVWIEIPKVACTSLKQALGEAVGCSTPELRQWRTYGCPELDITDPRLRGYFRFAFVRHPLDRLVSAWESKFNHPDPEAPEHAVYARPLARLLGVERVGFADFVRWVAAQADSEADDHWRSQITFVSDAGPGCCVDFIGSFERLEVDFARVTESLGLRARLGRHQVSKHRDSDWQGYFDAATLELALLRYAPDLRAFGYA